MRFHVHTFGCQMNAHDSERIGDVLRSHGWSETGGVEDADLVVFNTCSVREHAEQKLRSEVGKLAPLAKSRPDMLICVAGCVAQQEGDALLKRMPHVSIVLGPDNIPELPALAHAAMAGAPPIARTVFDVDAPRFLVAAPEPGKTAVSAYVTTMKGCDERCSFCVVPYTRGPERYRPAREIVDEIARLVAAGAREVTLLGQTVDSFQDAALLDSRMAEESQDPDETHFPALLRLIAREVPSLARLRYTSPHPRHATPSLARAHAELDVLARHVHLPVQSGADRVLKRMIRRYTRVEYIERARRLLAARPDMTMSTDVIVGFPGETNADFEETLTLVREMGFTSAFGFKYSVRPHTPARKLVDDVSDGQKSERLARLFEVVEEQGRAHLAKLQGTRQRVLVEGASKADRAGEGASTVQGRTERNEIVHVDAPKRARILGEIVEVEIVASYKHSLAGKLTEDALSKLATLPAEEKRTKRALPLAPAEGP